jgi:hypothetical protein
MTDEQFNQHMDRLSRTFRAAYSEERTLLFYQTVRNMSVAWWKQTVDYWIGEFRHAPLMPELKEAVARERERQSENTARVAVPEKFNSRPDCSTCRDVGVYLCKRKEHEGVWAFRCHCEKGLNDTRTAIPFYTAAHLAEYTYYEVQRRA